MMTLDEIRKLRGMTLSEFSRKSGLSPHTARNLMGYRELYGNPRMDTMVDAARALNAVVTIHPQGRDDPRQKGKRMTPIPFREQNITYNPPEGMEDKCEALPAFRGEGQVISCWHLTLWERIKLLLTGRLWFSVIGNGQPPIWLGVDCPFIRK